MQHLDKLYRQRRISGIVDVVEILSNDPENEYLVQVKYLPDGRISFINKKMLDSWKPVANGVQVSIFIQDLRERYQKLYKRINSTKS